MMHVETESGLGQDCVICREYHATDGEPCPADTTVSGVPLCRECAGDGLDLEALADYRIPSKLANGPLG